MGDSYYVVDRIESDVAVLVGDTGEKQDIARSSLPKGAKEGSCLKRSESEFLLDEAETVRREQRIKAKLNALFVD